MGHSAFNLLRLGITFSITPIIPIIPPFDPIEDSTVEIDFEPLGGFEIYNDNVNLIGHLTSRKYYFNAKERLSVCISGSEYTYFHSTAAHNISYNVTYDIVFTLPLKTMMTSKGIGVKVESIDENNNVLKSYMFALKPAPHQRINVNDYTVNQFKVTNVVVDPDKYFLLNYEAITFPNISSYFNQDYYYDLDLSGLTMKYICFMPFPGCEAKLKFIDYNRVFKNLDSSGDVPIVEIPLRTTIKTGQISFLFPEIMYVNPQTLDMSLKPKMGYIPTGHFYLPINQKQNLIDQVFTLEVDNFGYAKTSFSYDVTYLTSRSLVGDCDNSDYCVIGEVN